MLEREVTVGYPLGLHARPAAFFVQNASRYGAEIWLEKEGQRVNAKSILGILMLAAEGGCPLKLIVAGADEEEAIEELAKVLLEGRVE